MSNSKLDNIIKYHENLLDCGKKITIVRGLKTKEILNRLIEIEEGIVRFSIRREYDNKEFGDDYKRIMKQMPFIVKTLRKDNFSRQAVISHWDPEILQCITQLQFIVRCDKIHLFSTLRSSDVTGKLKNDIIFLSHILNYVSKKTNIKLGGMTIHIISMHKYI